MPNDTLLVSIPRDTIALLCAIPREQNEDIVAVIDRLARSRISPALDETEPGRRHLPAPILEKTRGKYQYVFLGEEGTADTLGRLLVDVLRCFADLDSSFLEKFSERRGRTRRYLSRSPRDIYPGREDLIPTAQNSDSQGIPFLV